ncbi:hypothetical protein NLI92_000869 [Priestia megaterium]|uniref:hypothetical protein n=1 Tax=Priestia megaterium TaxID=1404 RepID=UPI0021AD12D4|nr:hypothetical protein [Priestia megaterium]MCR8925580.1 hypothetical protein [Priestia megaterium]
MFYSSFYTPFQYSFYPYFMPSFARPIGFVVSPDGAMDNWWGKKPSWWGKITAFSRRLSSHYPVLYGQFSSL